MRGWTRPSAASWRRSGPSSRRRHEAARGRARSVGIRVDLPFEQEVNAFVSEAFEHRTFFTRLHQFVIASDAFVVAPGGIGTVLETLMVWQLLQVRHLEDTPLVLVGKMWPGLVKWARDSMLVTDPPLAGAADLTIPRCVKDADQAVAIIRAHHARWLRARGSRRRTGAGETKRARIRRSATRARSGRGRVATAASR
ncbi:MAG TPA: LOG family protein [Dongiaceae bacterium]|nr:LOG family protein [Dongiaceae bacterium]